MNSLTTTCEIGKLSLHQTATKPLYETPQSSLQLNAYQRYSSISNSLVAHAQQHTPSGERRGFLCGMSPRAIKGRHLITGLNRGRLRTCVMNSRPSDAGSLGYFINPETQCPSRTRALLLSSIRPPPRQAANCSVPRNTTFLP